MDTKTLVVGQYVRVNRGNYYYDAKVVKVTPDGVEVQTDYDKEPLRFDNNGKGCDGKGTFECGPVMDTKTLVVGQKVYMSSGIYYCEGVVVKVTPSGVDVQTDDGTWNAPHELLHFDDKGRSYITELRSSYDSTAHPLSPWGWDGNGTYECGPWFIDDMPFAEREALDEKERQEYRDKMLPFVTWWKSATHEQRLLPQPKSYIPQRGEIHEH